MPTNGAGQISLPSVWPSGVPASFQFYIQWWMVDGGTSLGFAGSNTLGVTSP